MTKDRYNREVIIGDCIVWTFSKISTYGGKIVSFTKNGLPLVIGYDYEGNKWNTDTWIVRTRFFIKIKQLI